MTCVGQGEGASPSHLLASYHRGEAGQACCTVGSNGRESRNGEITGANVKLKRRRKPGERAGRANVMSETGEQPLLGMQEGENLRENGEQGTATAKPGGRGGSGGKKQENESYMRTVARFGLLLTVFCLTLFTSTTLMSAVLPILPKRLEALEAGPHIQGAVFSAFPLAVLLLSPFIPQLAFRMGKITVLSIGILSEGSLEILFGYMEGICAGNIPAELWSYVAIRLLQGCGEAAISVPLISLVSERCPSIMGLAIGLQESLAGIGFAVGPVLGGLLYSIGGWHLPYLVLGVATLATFPLVLLALMHQQMETDPRASDGSEADSDNVADAEQEADEERPLNKSLPSSSSGASSGDEEEEEGDAVAADESEGGHYYVKKAPPMKELINPVTVDATVITIFCATAFGYIEPVIAQHIGNCLLIDTKQAAAMYTIIPAAYSAISFFGGPLADRVLGYRPLLIIGVVLLIIAHILLGPLPLLQINPGSTLMWICQSVSYLLLGLGASATFVPALPYMQSGVSYLGPAAEQTIIGPFNSIYYMGESLGPLIGSFACDKVGMPWGMTLPALVCMVCLGMSSILVAMDNPSSRRRYRWSRHSSESR